MKENKIGIICALKKESTVILEKMRDKKETKVGAFTYYTGTIGPKEAVVCVCGMGKVQAAICTEAMILTFSPEAILNVGIAGALDESLSIFDVVVSEKLVQHDMDSTALGDAPGFISGVDRVFVEADEDLRRAVMEAARTMGCHALSGTIASGDQFITSLSDKERIRGLFGAAACEMEGAAVALAAFLHKVPFCVIRTISDSVSGQNEIDYQTFSERAAQRGGELILSLLGA